MIRRFIIAALALFLLASLKSSAQGTELSPFNYGELFEQHGSIFLIIDHETGRIEEANRAAARFYGYSQEELESMYIQEIYILSPEEVAKERTTAFEQKRNFFIFQHRLADGEVRTVRVYSYPYAIGDREGLFTIIFDVTAEQQLAARTRAKQTAIIALSLLLVLIFAGVSYKFNQLWVKERRQQRLLAESERRYATLLSNLHGLVYRCKFDREWTMEYVSWGGEELTGYPAEDLLYNNKLSFNSIIHPEYKETLWQEWQVVVAAKSKFRQEYRIITRQGREKWVLELGRAVYDSRGEVAVLEGIITDVTPLKEAEARARANEERLKATLKSVGDGVIATNRQGQVEMINPVAQHLTMWTQEEAFGQPLTEVFKVIDEQTRLPVADPAAVALETGQTVTIANTALLVGKDGTERPIDDSVAPIKDEDGVLLGAVVVFRDSSEQRRRQREIEHLSYHDMLTGLYNRRFFETELERCNTARNHPLSVIYADVNDLKLINDAFGHAAGDQMLVASAGVIRAQCRSDDIIARIGGDEFAILLPRTDAAAAAAIANRITAGAAEEKVMGVVLSISLGWSTKLDESELMFQVIKNAEDHMYREKLLYKTAHRSSLVKVLHAALLHECGSEAIHAKRVSQLCVAIGEAYSLGKKELEELAIAGELHDIGKITVPIGLIEKADALSDAELEEIRRHAEAGYRLLNTLPEYAQLSEYVC
jgi:diguanylate cyclase (GGDEF)-like protein/PAS domain S-box-containing protein